MIVLGRDQYADDEPVLDERGGLAAVVRLTDSRADAPSLADIQLRQASRVVCVQWLLRFSGCVHQIADVRGLGPPDTAAQRLSALHA